jgi:hypothetical protein
MPQPDLDILMYEPYLLIVATLQIYKFLQKSSAVCLKKNGVNILSLHLSKIVGLVPGVVPKS